MGFLAKSAGVIDTPHKLAEYLGAFSQTESGVCITPETAMRQSAVFSCVRVIAESIGMLPTALFRLDGKNRSRAPDHPLHRIIAVAPNEYMTAREFWETAGYCLAHRGNFYAYKNVVRGELRELLPLHPDAVRPVLAADWSVQYEVTLANGEQVIWPQARVFHVRLFSLDGLNGLNPVAYMRETFGMDRAAMAHGGRMLRQGTRLSGVVSTDGVLKDDAYKRVRESWEATYGGIDNAYKVAILEGGLKFTPLSMTAQDAQFLEGRKFSRSEIAGIYRVPPHMIGDLDKATFSNIEHQGQEFVTNCLLSYLTKIEARIAVSLLSEKDRDTHYAKFNVNALARGDMKTRAEFYTRMEQAGAMSPNEIRELEEMNPRDGGDMYLTPMNMAIDGKPVESSKP